MHVAESDTQHLQLFVSKMKLRTRSTMQIFLPYFLLCALATAFSALSNSQQTKNDADLVREQLGYLPNNFISVSAWTLNSREPVAFKTYPLNGGAKRRQAKAEVEGQSVNSPFPTLYWLCNSKISTAVADLERRGFIQEFEANLKKNPELAKRLLRCHEEYADQRWNTLTEDDRTLLSTDDPSIFRMRNMMKHSGISGTNFTIFQEEEGSQINVASIKCLHAHYAHFRSTDQLSFSVNPVGEMIHESLAREFPDLEL